MAAHPDNKKLPTQKRLDLLLDKGSFQPLCEDIPTHFITGQGLINNRPVLILAVDNQSEVNATPYDLVRVQNSVIAQALSLRYPLLLLLDVKQKAEECNYRPPFISDSGHVLTSPDGMGHVYYMLCKLEGKVPRVCLSFGYMAGSASFFPGMCDAVAMRSNAGACIGRPDAARKMIGEEVTFDTLAGAAMHATTTGMTDTYFETDEQVLGWAKSVLSYLPINDRSATPIQTPTPPKAIDIPDEILIPANPDRVFDIRLVIDRLIDSGSLLEMKEYYAKEVITGFARIEGAVVGLVANESNQRMGVLFPETCRKISHFIELCSRFHIPMCFLVDTPGFMVGSAAEHGGLISAATQLYTTLAHSETPRMVAVIRKAHSAALYAMAGPGFCPTSFVALPTAAISIYGISAIARFVESDDLSEAERQSAHEMQQYATHPELFLKEGLVDEIVVIGELRTRIASFLEQVQQAVDPSVNGLTPDDLCS